MYENWEKYIPAANAAAQRICVRHTRYRVHLEDARQEARIALWKRAHAFDADYGITFWRFARDRVRGSVWDYLRSVEAATRADRTPLPELLSLSTPVADCLCGSVTLRTDLLMNRTQNALNALPERSQAILRLHCDGYYEAEIAAQYGLHQTRISQIIRKSLHRLRNQ